MKKFTLLLLSYFFCVFVLFGQAPNSFKYQAVVRNTSGSIIAEKVIGLRISIVQDAISGSAVYTETHSVTSNLYGIVNLNIGEGTVVLGSFSTIDWGNHSQFVKIEIDEAGGSNYVEMGTSPLLSVPYAKYAEKAGVSVSNPMDSLLFYSDNYKYSLKVDDDGNLIVNQLNTRYSPFWKQIASLPTRARSATAHFSIGGKGYIGLGVDSSANRLKDLWEYDPSSNTWTKKADYPGAGGLGCEPGASFMINGIGYVCCGKNNSNLFNSELWAYDPISNSWTQKANFPGVARYGAQCFVIGETAFVGTGSYDSGGNYPKDLWMYDPSTNTWTQKSDFPGGNRMAVASFTIGNYGYMGSGWDGYNFKSDLWKYNKNTNTWDQVQNIPGNTRGFVGSFSINGKGYAIGGIDAQSNNDKVLYEYDPTSNQWIQKQTAPNAFSGRCHSAIFTIGTVVYYGLGDGTVSYSSKKDFWSLTFGN